jgi:cytochrome c-type biogenesis protein CcmH/NrfG
MADPEHGRVSPCSPEQARVASGQFERAQEAVAAGNLDYAIGLLNSCCRINPTHLVYRQTLRRTVRAKFKNNQRGVWLAWLWNLPARWRLKRRLREEDYLGAVAVAEQILARNPWDHGAQVDLAHAAEGLDLDELATWSLEQARAGQPQNVRLMEQLAHLYEKQQLYPQATALWEQILKVRPGHLEAPGKLRQLAAGETIQRGRYQQVVANRESYRNGGEAVPVPARIETPVTEEKEPDRPRDAATNLRRKIEKDPRRREHYLALAALYRAAGDLTLAAAVLEQGLEPTGSAVELRAELLDVQIEPFRRQLAEVGTKLEAEPKNGELLDLRAHLRKEINARELDLYQLRVQRGPQDLRSRYELGVRLLRAGRVEEAIRELQQSREDARHRWQSLLFLGHCHKARNNAAQAIRHSQAALEAMPAEEVTGRKDALFLLACLHADAGDLGQAVRVGGELADLDGAYRDIGRLLAGWQAARSA